MLRGDVARFLKGAVGAFAALRADERRALAARAGVRVELPADVPAALHAAALAGCGAGGAQGAERDLGAAAVLRTPCLGLLRHRLGLEEHPVEPHLVDTVVGDTSSFRAISRKDAPSLSMSSISHLSSKPRCAPFFLGMASSFPGPGEGLVHGRETARRRKAAHARARRPSHRARAYAIRLQVQTGQVSSLRIQLRKIIGPSVAIANDASSNWSEPR